MRDIALLNKYARFYECRDPHQRTSYAHCTCHAQSKSAIRILNAVPRNLIKQPISHRPFGAGIVPARIQCR